MYHGIINVYKEKGFTSHDVVAKLRGITHQKKIGHTGTLDPDAEGVLPVCFGKGTKLCDLLTDHDKTYEAVLLLGVQTDTQDVSGKVLCEAPVTATEEEVRAAILSFLGESMQIPPMYSAVRHNGKKLYELARAGAVVERKPRPVTIYELEICEISLPYVRFRVTCSKGTYIRTLCADIGDKLGCGGCMQSLVRVRVGQFLLKDSLRLSALATLQEEDRFAEVLQPVDTFFADYPQYATKAYADPAAHNGNLIAAKEIQSNKGISEQKIRLYDSAGKFVGLFAYDGQRNAYCPVKMFYAENE